MLFCDSIIAGPIYSISIQLLTVKKLCTKEKIKSGWEWATSQSFTPLFSYLISLNSRRIFLFYQYYIEK